MAGNSGLQAANRAKQDEFYTQLTDIEIELRHYKKHFKGKTVFCNCDDPFESNFFKYFAMNFNFLGLKKLIATCYDGSPIAGDELPLFADDTTEPQKTAYNAQVVKNILNLNRWKEIISLHGTKGAKQKKKTCKCSAKSATAERAANDLSHRGGG